MERAEVVEAFKYFPYWAVSGDDGHLRADFNGYTRQMSVEFNNNGLMEIYFLDGAPIKVMIPYSEISKKGNEVYVKNFLGDTPLSKILGC